jgi:hypothetical protein
MQGAVPQFAGTSVGAGVFLALSHSTSCLVPCMYFQCDMDVYGLKFELTKICGLSSHYERFVLIQTYYAVRQDGDLVGNFQTKVLFEQADSDDKAKSTVLQNRMYLSQQNISDLLGTHICMPRLPSVTSKS